MARTQDEGAYRLRMTIRLAALIHLALTSRSMPSLAALALEHGVCERTIRRDLEAIELTMPVQWRKTEAA